MNHKNLLGPIVLRFLFFSLNFFFTVQVVSSSNNGWNFFSILLASFATRDLVQGIQLAQIYYYIYKGKNDKEG